ncbi:hypothetical protein J4481_02550 [Candidatus Pacearchaeota archaeon]|nr:hypothetical protein [Candidatus Pacearchaeota archaeon]
MKRGVKLVIVFFVLLLVGTFVFFAFKYYSPKESFSLDTVLLKLNIVEKGQTESNIKLTNNEDLEKSFSLSFSNLDGMVTLEETEFILSPGESKDIKILFKDSEGKVGVYVGDLIIDSNSVRKVLPIILNVEDKNRNFAIVNTPIKEYENVYPGAKFGLQIKMFNLLGDGLQEVGVKYVVKDFNDNVVLVEEENFAIKGSIEITKILDIPKSLSQGDYVFITSITYGDVVTNSGYLFKISERKEKVSFIDFNFLVFVVVGFIILIIILFFYFLRSSDELVSELEKQHHSQVKNYSAGIDDQKNKLMIQAKTEKEKKTILKNFNDAKKKIIVEMKREQKRQKVELKKMRFSKKSRKVIEDKFPKWGKEVYSKALETAQISNELKDKLGILKHAYSEGFISKDSFEKGKSRITSAHKKLKRKSL